MATDSPSERFDDVDWEREGASGLSAVSRKYLYAAVTLGVVGLAFLYDYFFVGVHENTVPPLHYSVSVVDWMFIVTLVVLFYFGAYPLYKNPRMTRYYWKEFRKNRAAVISLVFLSGVLLIGIVGPLFIDPPTFTLTQKFQPPVFASIDNQYPLQCAGRVANGRCHGTWAHPLGTSRRGKDILSAVVYGMQVSMKIGLVGSLMALTIGVIVGATAAYSGNLVDEVLMRYVDIQLVFPEFLLYLLLLYLYGASLWMFILVFGGLSWGGLARLVRSEALQRSEEEYITAADGAGGSSAYVIWRHIIPNVSSTVITAATLLIPSFLLFEASLAFLGLGDASIPSWGQIIAQGRSNLTYAWWVSTIPGLFLFLTILAFNFVGDALRDALDPRSQRGNS